MFTSLTIQADFLVSQIDLFLESTHCSIVSQAEVFLCYWSAENYSEKSDVYFVKMVLNLNTGVTTEPGTRTIFCVIVMGAPENKRRFCQIFVEALE